MAQFFKKIVAIKAPSTQVVLGAKTIATTWTTMAPCDWTQVDYADAITNTLSVQYDDGTTAVASTSDLPAIAFHRRHADLLDYLANGYITHNQVLTGVGTNQAGIVASTYGTSGMTASQVTSSGTLGAQVSSGTNGGRVLLENQTGTTGVSRVFDIINTGNMVKLQWLTDTAGGLATSVGNIQSTGSISWFQPHTFGAKVTHVSSQTSGAGLNIGTTGGSAPTTPADGDIFHIGMGDLRIRSSTTTYPIALSQPAGTSVAPVFNALSVTGAFTGTSATFKVAPSGTQRQETVLAQDSTGSVGAALGWDAQAGVAVAGTVRSTGGGTDLRLGTSANLNILTLPSAGGAILNIGPLTVTAGRILGLNAIQSQVSDNTAAIIENYYLTRGTGAGTYWAITTTGDTANGVASLGFKHSAGGSNVSIASNGTVTSTGNANSNVNSFVASNTNAGANAMAYFILQNNSGIKGGLGLSSSAYTATTGLAGDQIVVDGGGTGGTAVVASNASGKITFLTGGYALANQRMRINSSGTIDILSTGYAYPGQGYTAGLAALNIAGGIQGTGNLSMLGSIYGYEVASGVAATASSTAVAWSPSTQGSTLVVNWSLTAATTITIAAMQPGAEYRIMVQSWTTTYALTIACNGVWSKLNTVGTASNSITIPANSYTSNSTVMLVIKAIATNYFYYHFE